MWTTPWVLAVAIAAPMQETTEKDKASAEDLRAAFVELEDEYDAAKSEFWAEFQRRSEAADGGSFEWPDPIEPDFYPTFQEIADAGSPDAQVWCIRNHEHSGLEGEALITDRMTRYEDVLSASRDDDLLISLTWTLQTDLQMGLVRGQPEQSMGKEACFHFLDTIDELAKSDDVRAQSLFARGSGITPYSATPEQAAEGLAFYRKAAELYPETDTGMRCKGYVFAGENLQIGQKAPDIIGKDHDGNELKLSDFAGKVTVIDFWGFW
ncbi:MAG: hypothetical protein AAF726_03885 [Planctomycetota bacterium]